MSLGPRIEFTNTEVADVLERAVEHVRAGWTQHCVAEYVNGQRHVCGSGAVWLGVGMVIEPRPAVDDSTRFTLGADDVRTWVGTEDRGEMARRYQLWAAALDLIQERVGDTVPVWNDANGQTQDRVADTMLQVAKELRNNETP